MPEVDGDHVPERGLLTSLVALNESGAECYRGGLLQLCSVPLTACCSPASANAVNEATTGGRGGDGRTRPPSKWDPRRSASFDFRPHSLPLSLSPRASSLEQRSLLSLLSGGGGNGRVRQKDRGRASERGRKAVTGMTTDHAPSSGAFLASIYHPGQLSSGESNSRSSCCVPY